MTWLLAAAITVVCVHWTDATGFEGSWVTEEELLEEPPAKVISCGILVKETEKGVYLAMDKSTDPEYEIEYNQTGFIPGKWITKVVKCDVSIEEEE
ncbi:MAG: hypothetical protein ACW99G_17325 [Candidatus Thorarchaeota archaeon]|jgi:hypothetical protein